MFTCILCVYLICEYTTQDSEFQSVSGHRYASFIIHSFHFTDILLRHSSDNIF